MTFITIESINAFQSSTEYVNPFNKYLSTQNGVNLYTGSGYTSFPLSTGIPLSLSYSSNVTDNARAINKIAPTGWCGLGWQLGFGSISCDHKGTATVADDDYMWISPQGVPSKLLRPKKIHYKYYENTGTRWNQLPDFSGDPTNQGYSDYFNINLFNRTEDYAYVFETMIDLPYDGSYTFYLYSDDGSKLYIDGNLIVNNDGSHSAEWREGSTDQNTVKKGLHALKIEYFQGATKHVLNVMYSHSLIPRTQVPIERLYAPGSEIDGRKQFYAEQNPYC